MFENAAVVFTYTDEDAVRDGVLLDVRSFGLTADGRPVTFITASLAYEFGGWEWLEDAQGTLAAFCAKATRTPDNPDGRILTAEYGPVTYWWVENASGGYTMMLPEDY